MATVAERQYKMLTTKKETLFSIIQQLYDLSNALNVGANLQTFQTLYPSLESVKIDLSKVVDELNMVGFEVDKKFEPNFKILQTVNDLCCNIHCKAATIPKPSTGSSGSNSSMTTDPRSLPTLPRIELPEFSGNVREWETFYSIYKSLIHDNTTLTNSDKIHYLMGRLKGPALSICAGIAPTGVNYDIIWSVLLDRYQNKRVLANSYLDQIMDFRPLQTESAKNLYLFLEKFDSAVSALRNIGVSNLEDYIFSYLARSKLDVDTVKAFDSFNRGSTIPSYTDLVSFVKEQAKILNANNQPSTSTLGKPRGNKTFFVSHLKENKIFCIFCNQAGHYVGRCGKFKSLSPGKRYEIVREKNWCYNCLSDKHGVRSCTSDRTCSQCCKKHHILLHLAKVKTSTENITSITDQQGLNANTIANSKEDDGIICCSTVGKATNCDEHTVLLSTAIVNVVNSPVKDASARFLLDSGSQINLITADCCRKLGLTWAKHLSSVQGLGQTSQKIKGVTELIISSRFNKNEIFALKALLVDKITDKLPKVTVNIDNVIDLKDVALADNTFNRPGTIDGIIGADLFSEILRNNKITGRSGSPVAIQTLLGYVIMGNAPTVTVADPSIFFALHENESIEKLIEKFWEIEKVPHKESVSPDDLACEKIYLDTFSRDSSGRFEVALPFKYPPQNLGESKSNAQLRLLTLEKRFIKFPSLRLEYNKAMEDFITQGHLKLEDDQRDSEVGYYIPHHPVLKPESTSTPVRVVLDASAPSNNDMSLNDLLYSGPKLQKDIFTVLINFRLFKVAFAGDIRQMYRQINMIRDHWRFQRILWRSNLEEKIKTYVLTVVAFGLKPSPYLALRTVNQLLKEEKENFPLAAKYVEMGLYIDDFTCSVDSDQDAIELYNQVVHLFRKGCFDLTKFATNSKVLLETIPNEKLLTNSVSFKTETKVLGMIWDPELDSLAYRVHIPEKKCTKRIVLSTVARCYDPIGLIAPFILFLKVLVKELWKLRLDWDADPPEEICKLWMKIHNQWTDLEKIRFPRFLSAKEGSPILLAGFADASQDGYGAVIYLRTSICGETHVSLVCAKSKVASLKRMTIPRLELCAAHLLSKLLKHVIDAYSSRVPISKIMAFSDSSTVLSWLASEYLKDIFVSNRISDIKDNVSNAFWCHIEGENNPADCLSRGLTPYQLLNHTLWTSGPSFLKLPLSEWPIVFNENHNLSKFDNHQVFIQVETEENYDLLDNLARYSSWLRILRITVWVLKFVKVISKTALKRVTVSELWKAECVLLKLIQDKHFGKDLNLLRKGKQCSARLRKLRPFISNDLLRVGGRLRNSDLTPCQRHPIILPSKEILVNNLVQYYHKTYLHTGPYLLEALLRQKYWIMGGRNLIRNVVHKCNRCFRLNPKFLSPLMADLPAQRVNQTKVFLHTGVDYFGPFNITWSRRRGVKTEKAYACIFICMAVKAIHLELVSSLSTMHFLQAFKRFLSRRGPCQVLYSDRGTNFVGAKSILGDINAFINSPKFQNEIQSELAANGVEWKFNSPSAPHMGGLWEGNVRVVKNHLYRVLGEQILTYEEFNTLLTQVEALLNSRPLCQLSADTSAPEALTPSHFLTLTPLQSLPSQDMSQLDMKRLDRFQLIDKMVQSFWTRWRLEYLHSLQIRGKWDQNCTSIAIGTVVVLKIDNAPPLHWPLAVVTQVYPGQDGVIRNIQIKTNKGFLTRPVVKVCPLPTQ